MPVGHLKSALVPSQNNFNKSNPKDELDIEVDLQCLDNFRTEIRKLFSETVVVSLNQQSELFSLFTGMKTLRIRPWDGFMK